jgi:SAM-dependent methyltransferase
MIGRQPLPARYAQWNEQWGAPFGRPAALRTTIRERFEHPDLEAHGPFAYQVNSGTRTFEYPWAYFAAEPAPGLRILEIGGGTSGLQFVFALEGCEVVNADPGDMDYGWPMPLPSWEPNTAVHQRLNEAFRTDVLLVPSRLQDADLKPESFDRILCLSVIEHLSPEESGTLLARAVELLRPHGRLILTIDLFFDLIPFGVLSRNGYGTNIDVRALVSGLGLELLHGDPRELLGFSEFDRDRIVGLVPELFMSPSYPCVPQTLVLVKS